MHTAESDVSSRNITSIASLNSDEYKGELALVLDVEQIIYDIIPSGRKVDMSAIEDHVRKVGANGYVAKFDVKELSQVIHKALNGAVV